MNDLPIPLSRTDLYLAVAAGMTGVTMPDKPLSRLEQFLAYIAGDTSVTLPTPLSLTELWLAYVAGVQPKTDEMKLEGAYYIGGQKVDVRYFAVAGGMEGVTAPAPQNRTEEYWARIAEIRPIHGVLKYATGTSIALTDVISGIEELQYVYGDTTQQTYSGKNLWGGFSNDFSVSRSGIDFITHKDGTTDVSSGTTTTVSYSISLSEARNNNLSKTLPSGTYAIAGSVGNISVLVINVTTGALIATSSSGAPATFTLSETTDVFVRAQIEIDTTVSATIIKPMLEAGSATSYEPYVGGIPAPNPDYPQDVNVVTGEQKVGITGKNLASIKTSSTSPSVGGLPFVVQDGVIKINGESSSSSSFYFDSFKTNSNSAVFWMEITGYTDKPSGNGAIILQASDDNSAWSTLAELGMRSNHTHSRNVTLDSSKYYRVRLYVDNNTFTNATIKFQLEYGASATTFESYKSQSYTVNLGSIELCKIGDYQDYISKSSGKNLIDPTIATANTRLAMTSSTVSENGFSTSDYIKVTPNTTYTISTGVVASPYYGGLCEYDGSKVVVGNRVDISSSVQTYTFTTSSTTNYVRISEATSVFGVTLQLELGSATPYEPYGTDWYVRKETAKIALAASQFTQVVPVGNYMHAVVQPIPGKIAKGQVGAKCNMANFVTSGSTAVTGQFYENIPNFVFVGKSTDTLDTFKTTYTGALLYYVLATSTYTKITDATLISQLNAIGSAVLPKPIAYINVGATGTNLPGPLKISYYGEEE